MSDPAADWIGADEVRPPKPAPDPLFKTPLPRLTLASMFEPVDWAWGRVNRSSATGEPMTDSELLRVANVLLTVRQLIEKGGAM
jgi:hypothetical protein